MTTRSRKKTASATDAPATAPDASPDEVLALPGSTEPEAQPETAEPQEPVKETPPEQAGESVTLVYRGSADVLSHGAFRIRPGQPVTVPSDVAEELLTFPHERFEKVESQE